MIANTAPHDPVQASAGAREDQPLCLGAASGDVGNGMNRQREARVRGPVLGRHGRCARERLGLPAAEMHEDLTHHDEVVDQCVSAASAPSGEKFLRTHGG